jgi:uncharacterized LabA/DUF88 family protein
MRTNIYIDGFNVYYGALKGTPHKWLDPLQLCRLILTPSASATAPSPYQYQKIRYFTAEVKPWPNDPGQLSRQQAYIRAIGTLPGASVHYGAYLVSKPYRRIVGSPKVTLAGGTTVTLSDGTQGQLAAGQRARVAKTTPPQKIQIYKPEEKGSDVNLATHLLNDAHLNDYDCAIVLSNDSDLKEAIRIAKESLGRVVGVINPHKRKHASHVLKTTASWFVREIRPNVLARSQFSTTLQDSNGSFSKPPEW